MPSWPADPILLPWDINVGALWSYRTELPWSAGAGRDLNGDGFTSDLVPGTTRNSGSRDLNLDAVNVYRASLNLAPIDASTIDSSRINIMDIRVSKRIRFGGDRRLELIAQAFNLFNTENLQAQFGAGRNTNATLGDIRADHERTPAASGRAGAEAALVSRHRR